MASTLASLLFSMSFEVSIVMKQWVGYLYARAGAATARVTDTIMRMTLRSCIVEMDRSPWVEIVMVGEVE
jgi:hypothetical protein